MLARAKTAGVHISAVCNHIHQHDGASGVRRMLGVLALADLAAVPLHIVDELGFVPFDRIGGELLLNPPIGTSGGRRS